MEAHNIKFSIGEQLEKYEFQLSTVNEYLGNGISYEVYSYNGSGKTVFKQLADKILLHFNADILMKVEYFFGSNLLQHINQSLEFGSLKQSLFNHSVYCKLYYKEEENQTIF